MKGDMSSLTDRIAKLRSMRVELCKKESNWQKAFDVKDWINSQLNEVLKMSRDPNVTKKDIENRIEDILCVLEPEDDSDE
jgi:uncharacterized protein (DUF2342 family)